MSINIEDHIVYVNELKMEMVPLSVVKQALEEAYKYEEYQEKLDKAMSMMQNAFIEINNSVEDIDD